jgi:uncharacterized protein (DUF4415 family)
MPKKDTDHRAKKRARGRPAKGNVKVTSRLSAQVRDALTQASRMTGRGQSQIVEEALREYLHLGSAG